MGSGLCSGSKSVNTIDSHLKERKNKQSMSKEEEEEEERREIIAKQFEDKIQKEKLRGVVKK
jgi:hypothetical protein